MCDVCVFIHSIIMFLHRDPGMEDVFGEDSDSEGSDQVRYRPGMAVNHSLNSFQRTVLLFIDRIG